MDVIDWLLEDDAPGVAFVARRELLGEDPASRKMKSLRKRCNDYPPVARMLERLDEALAQAGVRHTPVLDDALDHIEKKRGRDGRWKLDDSLNGKMLADVERKGHPSKWVTLRAMTVLEHFGRIDV